MWLNSRGEGTEWPYAGGGRRAATTRAQCGQARDGKNAPLHSPQLTQRRTHPAVVYSTPARERQRPRVRRSHEEKTRGGIECSPTTCLGMRYGVPNIGRVLRHNRLLHHRHAFVILTSATSRGGAEPTPRSSALSRSGDRARCRRRMAAVLQLVRRESVAAQDLPGEPRAHRLIQNSP